VGALLKPGAVDTVVCAPDDGWNYHPKHAEQIPDINKPCNVAFCWIYKYTGILLEVHYILHISRIRVKLSKVLYFMEPTITVLVLQAKLYL
jgi:hypothetical protein